MQSQGGGDEHVERLNRQRAYTRRQVEKARSEDWITDEQAAEMIEREQHLGTSSEPFLLPGVQFVISCWLSLGSTVAEFGGMAPAVVDLSGMMYPARSMWLRDERATPEEKVLMHRFFRLLDSEFYSLKAKQLAKALSG
jgi:hypothetical protein